MSNDAEDRDSDRPFRVRPAGDDFVYRYDHVSSREHEQAPAGTGKGKRVKKRGAEPFYPLRVGEPVGEEFFSDAGLKGRWSAAAPREEPEYRGVVPENGSVPLVSAWMEKVGEENAPAYRLGESIRSIAYTARELYGDVRNYVSGMFRKGAEPPLGKKKAYGRNMLDWAPQAAILALALGVLTPVAVHKDKEFREINSPAYTEKQAAEREQMFTEVREMNERAVRNDHNMLFYVPSDSAELAELTPRSYRPPAPLTTSNGHEGGALLALMDPFLGNEHNFRGSASYEDSANAGDSTGTETIEDSLQETQAPIMQYGLDGMPSEPVVLQEPDSLAYEADSLGTNSIPRYPLDGMPSEPVVPQEPDSTAQYEAGTAAKKLEKELFDERKTARNTAPVAEKGAMEHVSNISIYIAPGGTLSEALLEALPSGYRIRGGSFWSKGNKLIENIEAQLGVKAENMQPGTYEIDLDALTVDALTASGDLYRTEGGKIVGLNREHLGPNTVKLKQGYGIEKVLREYFDGYKLPKSVLYGKDGKWGLVHETAKASGLSTDLESMKRIPLGTEITIPKESIDAVISGDTSENFEKYMDGARAERRAASISEIGRRYASGESASSIAADFAAPELKDREYIRKTGLEYAKNNGIVRNRFDCRALESALCMHGISASVPEYLSALKDELGTSGAKALLADVYGMKISDSHLRRQVRNYKTRFS